jgi:hypothetical protein
MRRPLPSPIMRLALVVSIPASAFAEDIKGIPDRTPLSGEEILRLYAPVMEFPRRGAGSAAAVISTECRTSRQPREGSA